MVSKIKYPLVVGLKLVILVPLGAMIFLAGYSLIAGWNLITLLLFWFIILPFLVFSLARLLHMRQVWQSMIALLCFYGWMTFLIYDHYQTDYFMVMIASLLYNSFIIMLVMLSKEHGNNAGAPGNQALN